MSNVKEVYMNNEKSLMIIDDDDVFRNRLITAMKRKGYNAFGASSVSEAISLVNTNCLLYTSPSPRDRQKSRMPSSA